MSKEERQRIYEYAMDRKNREMKQLEDIIAELRDNKERHDRMVIVAEVFLFLLGVIFGALIMKSFGMGAS